jgi:hypothetical protein
MLGYKRGSTGFGDMMETGTDLLLREYQEVNAYLRTNMTQFVNWFSFFLTFSFVVISIFAAAAIYRPELHSFALIYGMQVVFLLMHILAFIGIITFRRYIGASHSRIEEIVKQLGHTGRSPIPARFCQWMTDLMAAGFVISYFSWFSMLFIR